MNLKVKVVILSALLFGCSNTMPKLGINNGNLNDCPNSPNCVSSQAQDESHTIQAMQFEGSPKEAKTQLLKIINGMKRSKLIVAEDNYIHAEFISMIFRFVDDVEFYFTLSAENKTTIQVRSASRTGRSDFGVNRKRVEEIRNQLQ